MFEFIRVSCCVPAIAVADVVGIRRRSVPSLRKQRKLEAL